MNRIIIIMVGLPARGKSYISHKLDRYFNWSGINSRIFNAGNYRRKKSNITDHTFFSEENNKLRNELSEALFLELINWMIDSDDNRIAIFDATNSTKERRKKLIELINTFKINNLNICFIESVCNNKEIINENISMKATSPDYVDKGFEYMITDFNKRMINYIQLYEEFDTSEIEEYSNISHLRITNINKLFTIYNACGFLLSNVISFLFNLNINRNNIYITRHGESEFNIYTKIGGNPNITDKGTEYSKLLYEYMSSIYKKDEILIYISTLIRTKQTAQYFINNDYKIIESKYLDEIDAGIYDSLTYEEIKEKYPDEFEQRKKNKLNYRYPRGESYKDIIERIKRFIIDIERTDFPILIISHQATLRVLYSYLMNINNNKMTSIEMPLHTICKLEPFSYEYNEKRIDLFNTTT